MKYFFDTEFIEWAGGIDLVSIGIVSERGDTFYAESTNFDERNADNWVRKNVLSKLKWWGNSKSDRKMDYISTSLIPNKQICKFEVFGTNALISKHILRWIHFIERDAYQMPEGIDTTEYEFYAYYGAYDWVIFARLFGRLIDKPDKFPMWVRDLKQMMWERGLDKDWKDKNHPDPKGEHNALVDALWNKQLYEKIKEHDLK